MHKRIQTDTDTQTWMHECMDNHNDNQNDINRVDHSPQGTNPVRGMETEQECNWNRNRIGNISRENRGEDPEGRVMGMLGILGVLEHGGMVRNGDGGRGREQRR